LAAGVLRQVGEKLEIVWRGEPRRVDTRLSSTPVACDHCMPMQAEQIARGDPVRDPP